MDFEDLIQYMQSQNMSVEQIYALLCVATCCSHTDARRDEHAFRYVVCREVRGRWARWCSASLPAALEVSRRAAGEPVGHNCVLNSSATRSPKISAAVDAARPKHARQHARGDCAGAHGRLRLSNLSSSVVPLDLSFKKEDSIKEGDNCRDSAGESRGIILES